MSKGYDLGVDLYELWHAGKHLIPDVAEQFHQAGEALDGASSSWAWYRSGDLGSGGSYGAHSEFLALKSSLDGYLAQTYNNLHYTGIALVEAANDYEGTDAEAREEFEKRKKQMAG